MTSREARVVKVAGAIVIAALFIRMIPAVTHRWQRQRLQLRQQAALVARFEREVEFIGGLSELADSVRRQFLALDTAILAGRTGAEADASLSAHLNLAADRAGTLLQQAVPVADSATAGALHRVTARATFAGDTRGIVATLRSLAEDPVSMAVRTVRIVAPDPGSPDGTAETLSLERQVSAWYQERRP